MTTNAKARRNGTKSEPVPITVAPRVRLVGVTLQLDVVTDDGDTLTPIQVQPIPVTAAQWSSFDLAAVLAEIESQAIGQSPAPDA